MKRFIPASILILVFVGLSSFISNTNAMADDADNHPRSGLFGYINMDSIYTKYHFAIAVKDSIAQEERRIAEALKDVHTALSKDKADFELNVENNMSYTADEIEEARAKLNTNVDQVKEMYIKMENYMDMYQRDMFERVNKNIAEHIQDFSKTTDYQYIFVNSSSGWDLYTTAKHDLTDDFVRFMNERYSIMEKIGSSTK